MTKVQKIILCGGLVVILLMMLIPPNTVLESSGDSANFSINRVNRYEPFFTKSVKHINYDRLCLQMAVVLAVMAILFLINGGVQRSATERSQKLVGMIQELHQSNKEYQWQAKDHKRQIRQLTETNEMLQESIEHHMEAGTAFQQKYAELTAENAKISQEVVKLQGMEQELQECQELLRQIHKLKKSDPTAATEIVEEEASAPQEKKKPVSAGKKPAETSDESGDPRFASMRERMVREIEDLRGMITDSDL